MYRSPLEMSMNHPISVGACALPRKLVNLLNGFEDENWPRNDCVAKVIINGKKPTPKNEQHFSILPTQNFAYYKA